MSTLIKPISISLNPNVEKDDIFLALRVAFQPWKWKGGKSIDELESQFKEYFGVKHAISFNSGRSSLMAILKALGVKGEVLLQAFTCNATANPIRWSGLKPVYIDCSDDFNINLEDIKKKVTLESRVIMIQHTFGTPANMKEIVNFCNESGLILIEDCAHSLGAKYDNKKVGTFGKTAFFSFSRDKVISSVYGGMVITNDDELAEKIKKFQEDIGHPSYFWIKQQLWHPVLMNLALSSYRVIGKYLLVLFQSLRIMSKAVHWKEKRGDIPSYFPKRMPNALAILALNQFKKLDKFNNHRKEIANLYFQELKSSSFLLPRINENTQPVFLRFSVRHLRAHQIIRKAWDNNLLIGDWYTSSIAPDDTKMEKVGYIKESCPNAEKLAQETLNLPTHINISKEKALKIINFLKEYD